MGVGVIYTIRSKD